MSQVSITQAGKEGHGDGNSLPQALGFPGRLPRVQSGVFFAGSQCRALWHNTGVARRRQGPLAQGPNKGRLASTVLSRYSYCIEPKYKDQGRMAEKGVQLFCLMLRLLLFVHELLGVLEGYIARRSNSMPLAP